ncbi:MAG: ribonuclease III [Patescibacteria group bacterium]|jgi:ribonuclease-3|nr:ribonuclease III [Patescibacteria group bacterium]
MKNLNVLEKKINIKFNNIDLLQQALVHRSFINEHSEFSLGHNERLEFLGDAVLEIVITEYLFLNFPNQAEGVLTNWRASLVNTKMLYQVAKNLDFEDYLLLSKGESRDKNSKARQSILADSVEAVIGAIYLDQGMEVVKDFVLKNIISNLDQIIESKSYLDPKSRFQEVAQELRNITPSYKVLKEEGPDHAKKFTVGLFLEEELVAIGEGLSKQEAQAEAAEKGLKAKNWL